MKVYKPSLPELVVLEELMQKGDFRITDKFTAAVKELVKEYGHAPEVRVALLNAFDELHEHQPREARVQTICAIDEANKAGYKALENSLVCAWGHMFIQETSEEKRFKEVQVINRYKVSDVLQAKAQKIYADMKSR